MKLDSRIIDTIRRALSIYDPNRKLTADDLKDLKVLKLSNQHRPESESDISLVGLGKLGMIEHLSLTGFKISERDLDEIASIKMLKSITLNDCTGATIDLPNLERISISGGSFDAVLFDKMPKEYRITSYLGDDISTYIDANDYSTLEDLTIIGSKVSNMEGIKKLSQMKHLSIYESQMPEEYEETLNEIVSSGVEVTNEAHYKPVLDGR